ncbi:MAG: PEGA domain-containing protein, partial [Methanomicrobiales archaeon]
MGSTPSGASVYLDESNKGATPLTIPTVTYGTHTLKLTYPGYQDSSNQVTVSETSYTYVYTLTPTGQVSVVVPERTAVPNPTPTSNTTPQPNTTPELVINGTPLPVTTVINVTLNPGTNNTTIIAPVETSPTQNIPVNGSANEPKTDYKPPGGLAFFLFIAIIPLVLLLVHDYLGLGHLSFPQPLAVRAGVAIGQVVCGAGLLYVLTNMIALLHTFTDPLPFILLFIVLMLGAYLIFSALALAIGSLLSRPLRWTLKVHVVIGVITLLVTPILLFSLAPEEVMAILVTIVAAPVSALLALWQDHSLALEVRKRGFPFGLFNGDETRVPSGTDPYRRSTATRPDIFPPELADRYTSIDFLGMGGISHVFRAMRLKDGMTVAVKIPIRFDETTGKCFMKEILAWEGLRHPNIVEITEVNILPIPYVEMEFVKSGLADLKTPLPVKDAAEIISGVADGLAYAH